MTDNFIYEFDYDFDKERLLKEAMKQEEWRRGDNISGLKHVRFKDGKRINYDDSPRRMQYAFQRPPALYGSSRGPYKTILKGLPMDYFSKYANPDSCPYAMEIRNHLHNLTQAKCAFIPQFWLLKKGTSLPFHTDPFQCVINLILTEDPEPIRFKSSEESEDITEVAYTVGLVNTRTLHSVGGEKTRYLFKLPFSPRVSFNEVKEALTSNLSEI